MRERTRATTAELRSAIGCLPRATRLAMLRGIEGNEIVVGAYAYGGGICPMLAAHRAGGRTSLITFARAWDRFAFQNSRSRRARRATERELLVLRTHLEASFLEDETPVSSLGTVIAEHELLRERWRPAPQAVPPTTRRPQREPKARPGDPDRSRELGPRSGWAWMRPVKRLDDYQHALSRLEREDERIGRAPALARAGRS